MLVNDTSYRVLFGKERSTGSQNLDLSVIVPTRNEAGNIETLLERIQNAFAGASFSGTSIEVIFVDDSTDDTPQVVETAAGHFPNLHIQLIHRAPEQRADGLGGAVVTGLAAAISPYACVMDADLQHPPELVPVLLRAAEQEQADVVVATRRSVRSEVIGLNRSRNLLSRGLEMLARVLFSRALRGVSDPLTGFFLLRTKALKLDNLHPNGFKILLEILVRNPNLRKAEVPFRFGVRFSGQSKASVSEAWRYVNLLWALRFNGQFWRFAGFATVGASGILVNTLALYLSTDRLHIYYLLSAAIATVASTLWNFALTELWVYRASSTASGRARRLGLFSVVNVLALSLRTPMIYVLTSLASIHYVVSNLISLALLTVVRFELADNMIWSSALSTAPESKTKARAVSMKRRYSYNLHDIVTVVSEGELPELQPFKVASEIQDPTIRVQIGKPRRQKKGEKDTGYIHYAEVLGTLGFEVGIQLGQPVQVVASPSLRLSPHVLYTNVVEPLLRWTFVEKGYALVHGATLAFGDEACMITARTDTGKTTTLLKMLAYQRRSTDQAAFLSDDMTVVSPDGVAMTYPKPLTISFHTLRAVDAHTLRTHERLTLPFQSRIHSRTGRRFAFLISKTHLPAATINMLMQMVVPPPKYFVDQLVPNVKLARKAQLRRMFIIERGAEGTAAIDNREAVDVLLQNCEDAYGFPPYDALKEFLYVRQGVDLREKEQQIIRQAMGGLPATVVRSNTFGWWSRIPTFFDDVQISQDFARAHEVEASARNRYGRNPEVVSIQ
ncbi:MAG TPA: glycosyltransferase family 2 protein [Anaerolineales bacterium]